VVVPFPGIGWLERIATLSTEYRSSDGTLYSSVYDAILSGAPIDHPCRNFNAYLNSVFIPPRLASWVVDNIGGNLFWGHYILCYLRNFVAAMFVYYGTATIFHYHCYVHPRSKRIFANRTRPSWATILDQIKLAQASLFLYTLLPVLDEYLVESGWTQVYHTIDDIGGWLPFCFYTLLYFSLVEIGIYWMHRTLHTNKLLYKHVHMLHHKYNRAETLTPWCSIAFHPLDGILQASPYVIALFFVPCHYGLHVLMLFFTAIWATYIHDAMDFNLDPIMGSKYHTVHHTHYIYNYGQVFTFCDKFWGTLKIPEGPTGVPSSKRSKLEPTSRMINKLK
jgi:Delta7-sterol 5-desaturase